MVAIEKFLLMKNLVNHERILKRGEK